jgi:histidine ammonia-lyase
VYGINTGFGKLAQTHIPDDQLELLQKNLVLSHSVGVGRLLGDETLRLTMMLKVASLARGYSGVRPELVDALLALLNAEVYPCVPSKGSVGASGDLAPLAHLTAAMMGWGEVRHRGKIMKATEGLRVAGVEPLALGPKEGLAMLQRHAGLDRARAGGTIRGATPARRPPSSPARCRSMRRWGATPPSTPASTSCAGSTARWSSPRPIAVCWPGAEFARRISPATTRSRIPTVLRCQPQVMGACLDLMRSAARTLLIEANGVTDNPLVFPETDEALSGGNFHAEPVAFAADTLALAIAEIGALSERRIALLIDATLSGLPPFLTSASGVNSGFMIAHVTAAALASENKSLAHPASVDSLPTSANQEDHVSMATFAARRLGDMAENTAGIVAIELLAAAQGIDFRRPLRSSQPIEEAHAMIRAVAPHLDGDRFLATDIEAAKPLSCRGGS